MGEPIISGLLEYHEYSVHGAAGLLGDQEGLTRAAGERVHLHGAARTYDDSAAGAANGGACSGSDSCSSTCSGSCAGYLDAYPYSGADSNTAGACICARAYEASGPEDDHVSGSRAGGDLRWLACGGRDVDVRARGYVDHSDALLLEACHVLRVDRGHRVHEAAPQREGLGGSSACAAHADELAAASRCGGACSRACVALKCHDCRGQCQC